MREIKIQIEEVKDSFDLLKRELIDQGTTYDQGVRCREAKKVSIKDCYQLIHGGIKLPSKKGTTAPGSEPKGCCVIF